MFSFQNSKLLGDNRYQSHFAGFPGQQNIISFNICLHSRMKSNFYF